MSAQIKSNAMKPKASNQAGPSSSSSSMRPAEASSSRPSADAKRKSISKIEVNTKATSSSSKTVKKTVTKTREKKVFSLTGQKFDIPEEREPLRIFYESLSKQIPSSEMAEFWMMEHGLLSPERAKKAFEKKQRKQKQLRSGIPIKSPPPPISRIKPESSMKQQPEPKNSQVKEKRQSRDDSDDDDNIILSHKRRKV